MSTVGSVSIDEAGGTVTVEKLEIEDDELVQFLNQYDPSEHAELAAEAFSVGFKTMQLMDTSQDVEYVERRLGQLEDRLVDEVETFQEELDEHVGQDGNLQQALEDHVGEDGTLESRIEAAFSEDGPFVERLDKELGSDGERIQDALDPDRDGTPLNRLESQLKAEIRSVHEKIVETETEDDLRSRTYLKGGDFEDSIQQILEEITRQTPNTVDFTGDTTGEMGRDVGDFVLNLGDTGQNIVVEAKTESYSTQNIKDEMQEALQNRDAAYGIFVTDTLENLPQTKTGWFHEFRDQNTVIVAMSETSEQELEPGYLRMAVSWARMRAVQAYAEVGSGFDPEELQSRLAEIEDEIDRFQTIRGQCTEIRKSRKRIEETLDEIQKQVKRHLAEIESELIKASAD